MPPSRYYLGRDGESTATPTPKVEQFGMLGGPDSSNKPKRWGTPRDLVGRRQGAACPGTDTDRPRGTLPLCRRPTAKIGLLATTSELPFS